MENPLQCILLHQGYDGQAGGQAKWIWGIVIGVKKEVKGERSFIGDICGRQTGRITSAPAD
jgi:hypothetical protein